MKPQFEQLSILDIVMEHDIQPGIKPEQICQKDTERVTSNNNRCPYKIPTMDEIIKHIDNALIQHTNSLTREVWGAWKTPAFIFQYHRFYKFDKY